MPEKRELHRTLTVFVRYSEAFSRVLRSTCMCAYVCVRACMCAHTCMRELPKAGERITRKDERKLCSVFTQSWEWCLFPQPDQNTSRFTQYCTESIEGSGLNGRE